MTGRRSTSTSTSPGDGSGDVVVGIIRGPHGLRGEVRVDQLTDVEGRFAPGAVLRCDDVGPLTVAAVRAGPRGTVVRFAGIADRDAALALRNKALRVTRDEARRAVGGAYLWADLVGLRARDAGGNELGTVSEVLRAGETDVIVVARARGGELLVPALESVVRSVDLDGGTIVLAPQEELA